MNQNMQLVKMMMMMKKMMMMKMLMMKIMKLKIMRIMKKKIIVISRKIKKSIMKNFFRENNDNLYKINE
jgi:hypothetical protein